jgi:hypothetical protein
MELGKQRERGKETVCSVCKERKAKKVDRSGDECNSIEKRCKRERERASNVLSIGRFIRIDFNVKTSFNDGTFYRQYFIVLY